MKKQINFLLQKTKEEFVILKQKYDFNNFVENNMFEASYDIKTILDNLCSILDYVSIEISKKYKCSERKIYFIYANEKESKEEFEKRLKKYYKGIDDKLLNILSNVQIYNDINWCIDLKKICNPQKHVELVINKIIFENESILSNNNDCLMIDGNYAIEKNENNRYCFWAVGDRVSFYTNSRCKFFSDGTIAIGKGTYNINTGEIDNLNIEKIEKRILYFKYINKPVYGTLSEIIEGVAKLVSDLDYILEG